ncbi:hypothetical protein P154DRAFT_534320 [Amniculicola lignicola CBS 123094]|uniref:C2H2-type domain-containing protein n=1 Tax=Amniculicola lignicola CBS 123094 TaxID=1392246 RepID=A0A6A5WIW6_9PLEO|nr:hypothetical protein P154DRAFT_534320 [Amniculicola lignicola CBS 123094]
MSLAKHPIEDLPTKRQDTLRATAVDSCIYISNLNLGAFNEDFDTSFQYPNNKFQSMPSLFQTPNSPMPLDIQGPFHDPVIEVDLFFECMVCKFQLRNYDTLVTHAEDRVHETIFCLCGKILSSLEGHTCSEYPDANGQNFGYPKHQTSLNTYNEHGGHESETKHTIFKCEFPKCDKEYHRHDTYSRHRATQNKKAKRHLCPFCEKYSGSNGFVRKDHLTQHVRRVHPDELAASPNSGRRGRRPDG